MNIKLYRLFGLLTENEVLANNQSVVAGNSVTIAEFSPDQSEGNISIGYDINGGAGSPSVTLEYSLGTDVNGVDVWHSHSSSTAASDAFNVTRPVKKLRLVVSETTATAGNDLTGINAWKHTRPL